MTKKEKFINEVKAAIDGLEEVPEKYFSSDALDYWNSLLVSGDSGKPRFTENGKLVLGFMQENKDTFNNLFKAKEIGEGLSISSRTASGAMRKLVADGYAEKMGENPSIYSITDTGLNIDLSKE